MFDPASIHPIPDFSWQPVAETDGIKAYRHYYRLDKVVSSVDGAYHCFGNIYTKNFALTAQAFIHPDNQLNAFVVHGYTDHLGIYDQVIAALLHAGINVVGLDMPGHGLSLSGDRAGIKSFDCYQEAISGFIDEAMGQLKGSWFLLGQSTGGSVAIDYVLHKPEHRFKRLVLLAPLVIPRSWPIIKLQLMVIGRFAKAVPRKFNRNSGDKQFLRFVRRKDPLQPRWLKTSWVQALYDWQQHFETSPESEVPALLIQGNQDNVVEWQYNCAKVQEKLTKAELLLIEGANHQLVNEAEEIRKKVFSAIIQYIKIT